MKAVLRAGLGLTFLAMATWTVASALQASSPSDGAALYAKRCKMCHGADGKGYKALKSQDLADSKWQASVKDQDLASVIKNGKGKTMPAFAGKLKDDEIQAVVAHVRALNSEKKQ